LSIDPRFGLIHIRTNDSSSWIFDPLRCNNMATMVHLDLPAEDLDRAASFYGKMFGWNF